MTYNILKWTDLVFIERDGKRYQECITFSTTNRRTCRWYDTFYYNNDTNTTTTTTTNNNNNNNDDINAVSEQIDKYEYVDTLYCRH